MTEKTEAAAPPHEVLRVHESGVPVYRLADRPAHLLTKRELNRAGLARAHRQPVLGYARWFYYKKEGETPLYDRAAARAKKAVTPAQRAALERGRFLARAWQCYDCGELTDEPRSHPEQMMCAPCTTIRVQVRGLLDSLTLTPVLPARLPGVLDTVRTGPQEWAAALRDSASVVCLDTETSALHGWVVEVAVCGLDGGPLFETLVTPGGPISPGAQQVHGISAETLAEASAPRFSAVLDALGSAITGRCVVVYNLGYDLPVIAREVHRHARLAVGLDGAGALAYTGAWLRRARWADLMIPYSEWHGEWDRYRQDYRWQQLPYGDHRAAGDAAGAARLFGELGDGTAPRLDASERGPQPDDEDDYGVYE